MIFPITSSRWMRAIASIPTKPSARSVVWRIACSTASADTAVVVCCGRVKRRSSVIWVMRSGSPARVAVHADPAMRMLSGAGRTGPHRDLEDEPRAARRRRVGPRAAAVRVGDRLHDGEPEPGARRRRGSGRRRGGGSGRRPRRADRRGMPGPSSSTMNRTRPSPDSTPSIDGAVRGGVRDRVAQQVAQRLGQAVLVGLDEHLRDRADHEAPRRDVREPPDEVLHERAQLDDATGAGTPPRRPGRAAACPRRGGSSARSRRPTSFSTRRTSSASGCSVSASTSSWPRMTVSGVRSSCDASATNAVWRSNASWRRSSMWSNASASTRTSSLAVADLHARAEVAAVDARGDARHPPQRRGDARGDREAARQRRERGQRAGEQELVAHGPLGAVGRRGRLAHPGPRDDAPARPRSPGRAAGCDRRRAARGRVKPGGAARNARAARFSLRLLGARSRARRPVARPRSSGSLLTVAPAHRGRRRARGWSAGTAGGRGSARARAATAARARRARATTACPSAAMSERTSWRERAESSRAVPAYTAAKAIPTQTTDDPDDQQRDPRSQAPPVASCRRAAGSRPSARSRSARAGRRRASLRRR